MTNSEIRNRYESGQFLTDMQVNQIQKDISQTANSQNENESDIDFLNEFWENYCPEDDGNEFVRVDKF